MNNNQLTALIAAIAVAAFAIIAFPYIFGSPGQSQGGNSVLEISGVCSQYETARDTARYMCGINSQLSAEMTEEEKADGDKNCFDLLARASELRNKGNCQDVDITMTFQ